MPHHFADANAVEVLVDDAAETLFAASLPVRRPRRDH
jgi:hypothetical protein